MGLCNGIHIREVQPEPQEEVSEKVVEGLQAGTLRLSRPHGLALATEWAGIKKAHTHADGAIEEPPT